MIPANNPPEIDRLIHLKKHLGGMTMSKLISCQFNIDTACVELVFDDGSQLSIDCTAVENEVADNRFQRSELDYLIYLADTKKNIRGYVVSFAELCKGGRTDAGFFSQITLFHIFVNKHLPELVIADVHIGKSPLTPRRQHISAGRSRRLHTMPRTQSNAQSRKNLTVMN